MKKIVLFLLSILSCGFITAGVVIGYADTKGETAGGANSGYGGYTVNIGDEIVVQEKSLSFGDETKKAGVKIISPSGRATAESVSALPKRAYIPWFTAHILKTTEKWKR